MQRNHVSEFRKAFKIDKKTDLSGLVVMIDAIYNAMEFGHNAMWKPDWPTPEVGFRVQSLTNLLARTFEHAQAMVVATATGSPASSEVLGRTVIEASVNVMYLVEKGDGGTLLNFMHTWLAEHTKKLTDWRSHIEQTSPSSDLVGRIDSRKDMLDSLRDYLAGVEIHCDLQAARANSPWPKQLLQRFQALGLDDEYFEYYHRLSGACHLTSEDTISYLISLEESDEFKVRLAKEAWAYSKMMTMFACLFFVNAASACARVFGESSSSLNDDRMKLVRQIMDMAPAAGVPNVT